MEPAQKQNEMQDLKSLLKEKSLRLTPYLKKACGIIASEILENTEKSILYIADSDEEINALETEINFFAPHKKVFKYPSLGLSPYEMNNPNSQVINLRSKTIRDVNKYKKQSIIITSLSAILEKIPPQQDGLEADFKIAVGDKISPLAISEKLLALGYSRVSSVMEVGEFALRGDVLDIFVPGIENPLRIDFFGDDIENIKYFDALSQRSIINTNISEFSLILAQNLSFSPGEIERFRMAYREHFGAASLSDGLYERVSNGHLYNGIHNWLPLFYEKMNSLFDYLPKDLKIIISPEFKMMLKTFAQEVRSGYELRKDLVQKGEIFNLLPPEELYLSEKDILRYINQDEIVSFSFSGLEEDVHEISLIQNIKILGLTDYKIETLFLKLSDFLSHKELQKKVIIVFRSKSALNSFLNDANENNFNNIYNIDSYKDISNSKLESNVGVLYSNMESGYSYNNLILLSENDIFPKKNLDIKYKKLKNKNIINDVSDIELSDLLVHIDHGIGRYDGLVTLEVSGAKHDCLKLIYDGGDKLFVPIENMDMLSKFGAESENVPLDRLGAANWQERKARVKKRIREMAEGLIKLAAARMMQKTEPIQVDSGEYEEFCKGFAYVETEDQLNAISDTLSDLAKDVPMDRLICGDVGFGKTEVALRAAFAVVASGGQVALIAPTTLLARQHYINFKERFANFGARIEMLSRMVTHAQSQKSKKNMGEGLADIVIGTHAMLAKDVKFKNLRLIIVDEEQHFGVSHKEKLKAMRENVHVLTLSATPIPRTLQLSLLGIKSLSLITTPPANRLPVHTVVGPPDAISIREAASREVMRGGQIYWVVPKIRNIAENLRLIEKIMPNLKIAVAHGQLPMRTLETVMKDFAAKKYDLLLATNIIESGIDISSANTMFIATPAHFGLSQLYQLRGRIGRGSQRGYCYILASNFESMTENAKRRIEVIKSLESLGSGFNLASYDMDIRGAGNILGEEQSGHIREVGIELYQNMLEDAVRKLRAASLNPPAAKKEESQVVEKEAKEEPEITIEERFSPQIKLEIEVLIPSEYITNVGDRLDVYKRLSLAENDEEISEITLELADRFGRKLPDSARNLIELAKLKNLCRAHNIEKVDVGERAIVFSFRNSAPKNIEALIAKAAENPMLVKIRPDSKLQYNRVLEVGNETTHLRKIIEFMFKGENE